MTGAGQAIPRRSAYITKRHGAWNLTSIGLLQLAIVAWFALAADRLPPPVYIVLSVLFCAIQQRQNSEWLHEGLHFNIHPTRQINEAITTLLAALFGTPVGPMRRAHYHHHAVTTFFTADDRDTAYATLDSRRSLAPALLSDLLGITALRGYAGAILSRVPVAWGVPRQTDVVSAVFATYRYVAVVQVGLLGFCLLTDRLDAYVLYYAAMLSVYPLLSRIRLYGQHLEILPDGSSRIAGSTISRTIQGTVIDRLLISSRVMQYHYEHHLYPALPFRALEEMARGSDSEINRYTTSHWPVLVALLKRK
ncbi:MAG: fatty acid desaturase family protein [Ferrovibrio sp.]